MTAPGLWDRLFAAQYPLPWHMRIGERLTFLVIVQQLKPAIAIEIGTALGGSLQVLAAHAGTVYSLETDPSTPQRLAQFPNVQFRIGPAHETLPGLLAELHAAQTPCPLILIDGNHATEFVRWDIEALLSVPPLGVTYVLLHDSFHPPCREGIRTAGWDASPYVQSVQLDFECGWLTNEATEHPDQMWGGFALAILTPEPRDGPLTIHAAQQRTFEQMLKVSAHRRSL